MAKVRLALLMLAMGLAVGLLRAPDPAPRPKAETPLSQVPEVAQAAAPKTVLSIATRETPQAPVKPEPQAWDSLRERVRALESTDQPGLERLYQDAAEWIREDEPRALKEIESSYARLLESRLEEGFFAVSAWVRSSHAPAQVLRVIWTQAPKGPDAQPAQHGPMTSGERHRRIEAYALRELRRRVDAGKVSFQSGEKTALVAQIQTRAGEASSLDVGLEAFQCLAALGAQAEIQSALKVRPAEERTLIAQILDPNT